MDDQGNTIVAEDVNDLRRKLIEATRGINPAGVTLTVWRVNSLSPYTLHMEWQTLAALIAAREYDSVPEHGGVHAMAYAAGGE